MQIIDEDYARKQIEKQLDDFKNKLPIIKTDCRVLRDVEWQNDYILYQKESVLELTSIMEYIEYQLEDDFFASSLCEKDANDIVGLISQLKNKLLEIDSSLEEKYKTLIEAHQWIEDQKEVLD